MEKDEISELISGILNALGDSVVSIILYGSVAKGTNELDSDVDIAVILSLHQRHGSLQAHLHYPAFGLPGPHRLLFDYICRITPYALSSRDVLQGLAHGIGGSHLVKEGLPEHATHSARVHQADALDA